MEPFRLRSGSFWPDWFSVGAVTATPSALLVELISQQRAPRCPACGTRSRRVHSRYQRRLSDLPCLDQPLRLILTVRRLRCEHHNCPKRYFVSRWRSLLALTRVPRSA